MANDVKALPVVAWARADDSDCVMSTAQKHVAENHQGAPGKRIAEAFSEALVRQSDAESALAELRGEVERWASEAMKQFEDCEKWRDIADQHAQRADTAEARLERAEEVLRDCEATAVRRGDKYLCDAIDNNGEPYQSHALAAFLGEGNG